MIPLFDIYHFMVAFLAFLILILSKVKKDIIDDYIVQTRKIAECGYEESIKEILESEIKSSEVNTNGL